MTNTTSAYLAVSQNLSRYQAMTAAEPAVKSATAYYEANIGSVTSIKDLVGNYRLLSYALDAYGLGDQIDSTALITKVLEGGVSNGEDIRVRGYLKPISTLRRPLESVDFATREPVKAAYERSDVCVVPAAGVAAEAMVALTLARCALEKFGGDSVSEVRRNLESYVAAIPELLQ